MRRRLGNNDALVAQLLGMFLDGYPAQLAAIQAAVDVRHLDGVRRTAHTLKGAASNLSASGVVEAASTLEDMAESGQTDGLDAQYARLVSAGDDLVADVRRMLAAEARPRMRVLIADDDPLSAEVLAQTLTPDAFDVTIVRDGAAALEVLRRPDAPPLAILDWMMPQVDGPDVCRLIRGETPGAHRYLILLTSREAREDVVVGLEAGADDYLIKPFHQGELLARVSVGARVLSLQDGLAARVDELALALSQVKQLSGLFPICSYCKSIRSDDNYWQQVDSYLVQHSDAKFTHGICPPCFANFSKELDEYAREKGKGKLSI